MFGDGIKYLCRLYCRFIIDLNDRQHALNTQSCGLSHYQSRKMCQPLDYYTSDSSSNGDEQWKCTRAMACIAQTVTPVRRRMIWSTATHPATSLASQRIVRALARRRMLFSLSLETQIPLESMTFYRLGNPWGYQPI
jgi:hypothetical protein